MEQTAAPHRGSRILIADDEAENRRVLESMLRTNDYEVRSVVDGAEALSLIKTYQPDLIILDVMMPRLNGFDTTRELKRDSSTKNIPIILLTSLDDRASRLHGLAAGAEEFLTKPIERTELLVRVRNLLRMKTYGDQLAIYNRALEERVRERTAQLRGNYRETIHLLAATVEYQDDTAAAHVRRISHYTAELARHMGLGQDYAETIFFASPMHDIGKIGVPEDLLLKPAPLTDSEWVVMKTHAALGQRILQFGQSSYMRMGNEIAGAHHERWNGGGYPHGLKGLAIPLSARITNICDQYDALRSRRPHKEPLTHFRSVEILTQGDGRTQPEHFDPAVLAAFVQIQDSFNDIFETELEDKPPVSTTG